MTVFLMFSCAASYGVFTINPERVALCLLYLNWAMSTEVYCLFIRIEALDTDCFIFAPSVRHGNVHVCPT